MTDDKLSDSFHELIRECQRFKDENVRIFAVGFGLHPDIGELEALATSHSKFLYHGDVALDTIIQKMLRSK